MATKIKLGTAVEHLIQVESEKRGLDYKLVQAICMHESLGVPWKTRYEPHTTKYVRMHREYASRLGISGETEMQAQMHSYGIGQIMGFLARELGYLDYLVKLCDPKESIPLVCKHLQRLSQRFESEAAVVSAYNQGSPKTTPGGHFENQPYVDAVYMILRELRMLD